MGDALSLLLPYSILVGVVASALASLTIVVAFISNRGRSRASLLSRLEKIEAALRSDTSKLSVQLVQAHSSIPPERAKTVVSDLSILAEDLHRRAEEVQNILNDLRIENSRNSEPETTKKIVELGIKVGQTESSLDRVVRKLEEEKKLLELAGSGDGAL